MPFRVLHARASRPGLGLFILAATSLVAIVASVAPIPASAGWFRPGLEACRTGFAKLTGASRRPPLPTVAVHPDPQSAWDTLPLAVDAVLPDGFVGQLLARPEIRKLKEELRDGKGLSFGVGFLESKSSSGWSQQGKFVAKVLRRLFPESRIAGVEPDNVHTINLPLNDSAISRPEPGSPKALGLEMAVVKAVNPGPPPVRLEEARRGLGLPANYRIASLSTGGAIDAPEYAPVAARLLDADAADIVIFSHSTRKPRQLLDELTQELAPLGIHVIKPSMARELPANPRGAKYVIVNDTKGRMPYVHAAADYTVIVGPVNPFESLNMARATFVEADTRGKFDQAGLDQIVNVAEKSGGAFAYRGWNDLIAKIRSLSGRVPARKIYEIDDASGSAPLDRFARDFAAAIRAQSHPPVR